MEDILESTSHTTLTTLVGYLFPQALPIMDPPTQYLLIALTVAAWFHPIVIFLITWWLQRHLQQGRFSQISPPAQLTPRQPAAWTWYRLTAFFNCTVIAMNVIGRYHSSDTCSKDMMDWMFGTTSKTHQVKISACEDSFNALSRDKNEKG